VVQAEGYHFSEQKATELYMARLLELGLGGSLLLLDRWYPSREFIAYTLYSGFSFVMRVRKKWNLTVDAIDQEGFLTVSHKGQDYRIRVIKVTLPSGEVETLLTNLSEKQLPKLRDNMFQKLCADIALPPEPVRPGRSPIRKSPRNKRFPVTKKSVLP